SDHPQRHPLTDLARFPIATGNFHKLLRPPHEACCNANIDSCPALLAHCSRRFVCSYYLMRSLNTARISPKLPTRLFSAISPLQQNSSPSISMLLNVEVQVFVTSSRR